MKDYSESTLKDLQGVITEQRLEIDRLTTENKLFRQASEEQRELNGKLRMELDAYHVTTIFNSMLAAEEQAEDKLYE